jgi:hypothetical protein
VIEVSEDAIVQGRLVVRFSRFAARDIAYCRSAETLCFVRIPAIGFTSLLEGFEVASKIPIGIVA